MRAARAEYFGKRWEERVVDASRLNYDAHDRRLLYNEDLMPKLPTPRSRASRFALVCRREVLDQKELYVRLEQVYSCDCICDLTPFGASGHGF